MTDINEIKEFLTNTDEGKALLEEFKQPLLNKRNELLADLTKTKTDLELIRQAEQAKAAEFEAKQRAIHEEKLLKDNDLNAYKKYHEEEVGKLTSSMKDLQHRYAQKEAERVITETAAKYSRAPKPLQLLLKERVKPVLDETGNVSLQVFGEDGEQMYFAGKPAGVDHLVETLRSSEDYAPFFAGSGVSGSGTQKSEAIPTGTYKDMSSNEFNLTKTMAKTRK